MEAVMKKYLYILTAVAGGIALASAAFAQLPANPWQAQPPKPNSGYFGDNVADKSPAAVPDAPVYGNGVTEGAVLPVDPWARARDRTGTQTWRGSGNHGRLNYVGEATTYTDAQGQEMIAPEVNRHNMIIATEHLRKMGYKIPKSYDEKIKNMPQAYAEKLREAYSDVFTLNDPLSKSFSQMMTDVENGTGLDFENLLFNSIDILSTD